MIDCQSICTGNRRSYCTIGVNDLGVYECVECGSLSTKGGIIKNLKIRFNQHWEANYKSLKSMKRSVTSSLKKYRNQGMQVAERVYYEEFENPEEHLTCKKTQRDNPDNNESRFTTKKYFLTSYKSH